jgi:hypothetical protein
MFRQPKFTFIIRLRSTRARPRRRDRNRAFLSWGPDDYEDEEEDNYDWATSPNRSGITEDCGHPTGKIIPCILRDQWHRSSHADDLSSKAWRFSDDFDPTPETASGQQSV